MLTCGDTNPVLCFLPRSVALSTLPLCVGVHAHSSPSTTSLTFFGKHILSAKQFVRQELHQLFSVAHEMKMNVERKHIDDRLKGKVRVEPKGAWVGD